MQRARLAVEQQALVVARDQDQRRRVEIKRSRRRRQWRVLEIGEQPLGQNRVVLEAAALVGQRLGDLVGSVGGASRVCVLLASRRAETATAERSGNSSSASASSAGGAGSVLLPIMSGDTSQKAESRIQNPEVCELRMACSKDFGFWILDFCAGLGSDDETGDEAEDPNESLRIRAPFTALRPEQIPRAW